MLDGYFGLLFTLLVAITMWIGAGQAIRHGKVAARLPPFDAARAGPGRWSRSPPPRRWPRRSGSRAERRPAPSRSSTAPGRCSAFVHGASARAVPAERRPWVPIGDVTRRWTEHHVLPGDLRGTDLLQAIRDDPGGDYLVVTGEDVHGVLRGAELLSLVETRRPDGRPTSGRNRT